MEKFNPSFIQEKPSKDESLSEQPSEEEIMVTAEDSTDKTAQYEVAAAAPPLEILLDQDLDQTYPNPENKGILAETKDYLKYKGLKLKEYFGQLNQDDFDYLLEIDFQEQLNDTPPLTGYSGNFSPSEELQKIKDLPKEQRREALATFKEDLARQRKGLAAMRVFIERSIKFNHDIPKEKLTELVEKFSEQYRFDEHQQSIAEATIDNYYKSRQKVLKIREEFPDNHDLVKELTGVELDKNEKIDISVGPASIDIYADGANIAKLHGDPPGQAPKLDGFASFGKNFTNYTVIKNQKQSKLDSLLNKTNEKEQKTLDHEHEHVKNTLLRQINIDGYLSLDILKNKTAYINQPDPELKKVLLEDYLHNYQNLALERARDEITAKLQNYTLTELRNNLNVNFFSNRGGSYDYLFKKRNQAEFKDDPLYQETVEKILVKEYRDIIQKAVNSYAALVEAGDFSTQEAIALLTDKSIKKWPKTIQRLLEQKVGIDKTKDLLKDIEKPELLSWAQETLYRTYELGLNHSVPEFMTLYSLLVDDSDPNNRRWKKRDKVDMEKVKIALDQVLRVETYLVEPPLTSPISDTDKDIKTSN